MIIQYVLEFGSGILRRSIPFIITSREKEYFVSPAENQVLSVYNHKEADNRLGLHASKIGSDVAIVCKDTDVLIFMILAYSKLNITNIWYFKHGHEKFTDIRKTCFSLGKTLLQDLPKIHALGCNTTSLPSRENFKNLLRQQNLYFLLSDLGNYFQKTNNVIEDTKEFIRVAVYNRVRQRVITIPELKDTKV